VLAQTTPECRESTASRCFYTTSQKLRFNSAPLSVTYIDVTNSRRTVAVLVRVPLGIDGPLPVVIWGHGGAEGRTNPETVMDTWSDTTAEAGYLTVTVAYTPRSPIENRRLCEAIELTQEECSTFKHLHWDRPHDLKQILDELERFNTAGPLQGRINLRRIAVGGHSSGAGGALTIAGATRLFGSTVYSFHDPRPTAFVALSPQQPGSEGFVDTDFGRPEHSWTPLNRPILMATGDGDSSCKPAYDCSGQTPTGRRSIFERFPAGNKYRLYLHDSDSFHEMFELNYKRCLELEVQEAKCQAMSATLSSTVAAFLDAYLRNLEPARQWLQTRNIEVATGSAAEWNIK